MKNRLHYVKRPIFLLGWLLCSFGAFAQSDFVFTFNGADTLYVGEDCTTTLFRSDTINGNVVVVPNWGTGTPTVELSSNAPTGAMLLADSGFDAGLTGFERMEAIAPDTSFQVAYIVAHDGAGNASEADQDTFYFDIAVVDTLGPFINVDANVTVNCTTDLPPMMVTPEDNCDGTLAPVNSTDMIITPVGATEIDNCEDGEIVRTWTATDAFGNVTTVSQVVFLAPDATPPSFNNYVPSNDTVDCNNADFETWLVNEETAIRNEMTDNCVNVSDIMLTNNADINDLTCNTPMVVTFTIADTCGRAATMDASYMIIDTIAPMLIGVPDTIPYLSCNDNIPAPAMVTATDNCSAIDTVFFMETSAATGTGACADYNFTLTRTWTAVDSCGNMAVGVQTITVADTTRPVFVAPVDTTIYDCVSLDTLMMDFVAEPTDDCDTMVVATFADDTVSMTCAYSYVIERTWRAEDDCGNVAEQIQTITVADTTAPTFILPPDITVNCGEAGNFDLTGLPSNVMDNCDADPSVTFIDNFSQGSCANGGTIERRWRATDACGNVSVVQTQMITVNDDEAPVLIDEAMDVTLQCADSLNADQLFAEWIADHGGATATDNCTPTDMLTWLAYNTGTNDNATLPAEDCVDGSTIYRTQTVDFIVQDECGNQDTTMATFMLVDEEAPVLVGCHRDTIIYLTDPDECIERFDVFPLPVSDACGVSIMPYTSNFANNEFDVESANPGNDTVPVRSIQVEFYPPQPPLFANGNAELTIRLKGVDAEQPTEYYNIIDEDGEILGRTENTPDQCDTSITVINNITPSQISEWAFDSRVVFRLVPNIPSGLDGDFAINDICPGATVDFKLTFDMTNPTGIDYDFSIDGSDRLGFPFPVYPANLDAGDHSVSFFVSDCSGNTDSCMFNITVIDTFPPRLVCNGNQIVPIDDSLCTASFTIPLPETITDNCDIDVQYEQTQPATIDEAYLTFSLHPNLNKFLADDKVFTFTDVAANATEDVILNIALQADIDNSGEYFDIFGEDGTDLGRTLFLGRCDTVINRTLLIDEDLFNEWAADGSVTITAVSHVNFPFPPGGDGINPCDSTLVQMDGDIDSISTIYATLAYQQVNPIFMTDGATTIPMTNMMPPEVNPTFDFNLGETFITYFVSDIYGNEGTCTDTISVVDTEAPTALCQPTTVFINPSGTVNDTIQVSDIDNGSFDNCMVADLSVSPSVFSCEDADGNDIPVTLTVTDASGNSSTCTVPVRVVTEAPEPDFFVTPCSSDTLFLFANPPAGPGNIVYTYLWSGPNNFVSNLENPIIPNPNSNNVGSYVVTVTGITGCQSTGVVEVTIGSIPTSPNITAPANVCSDQELDLTTVVIPGNNVLYNWYEGTPPNGTLLASTPDPNFTIADPTVGNHNYYLVVVRSNCPSLPSNVITVNVSQVPTAIVNNSNITLCEGETLTLGTPVMGADITYAWTGPGFSSNLQIPPPIQDVDDNNAGVYTLVVTRNGCESNPAFVAVNVLDSPDQPLINSNSPLCVGSELTLNASVQGADSYTWTSPTFDTLVTAGPTLTIDSATIALHDGNWTVYATTANCDSPMSLNETVVINARPNLAISADPNPACEGSDVQLQATPFLEGATYEWTGPDGTFFSAAQNPIIEDIKIDAAGTYTCVITAANGCTNTRSIELVVREGVEITGLTHNGQPCLEGPTDFLFNSTVFPFNDGNFEYEWTGPNGQVVSLDSFLVIQGGTEADAGVYTLVVTNSNGCPSEPETIDLNVSDPPAVPSAPTYSESTQPPFCEGDVIILESDAYAGDEVFYFWSTPNGSQSPTTVPSLTINPADTALNGLYSVRVLVNGCQSSESAPINLNVNATPVAVLNEDQDICEGEIIRLMCEPIEGATYEWTGPNGFTASVSNPIIPQANPNVHGGTYVCTITVNSCESLPASTNVVIIEAPTLPVVSNNGPLCIDEPNTQLVLTVNPETATPGASYIWYYNDIQISASSPALTFTVTNLQGYGEGVHQFYGEAVLDGCSSNLSLPTEVTLNTIPDNAAFAGDDFDACENGSILLNGTAPTIGTGLWTQTSGNPVTISNPNQSNTTLGDLVGGEMYSFEWTLSNGACENYDSDNVTVSVDVFEQAFAGNNIDTCQASSLLLNATPAISGEGEWTQSDAQAALGVIIVDPSDPDSEVMGLVPGNEYSFTWSILDNTCGVSSDNLAVNVAAGIAYAGEDYVACGAGCEEISAANESGVWSSPDPNIDFTDPNASTTTVCGLKEGINTLIWTINNGNCGDDSTDELIITYESGPMALPDAVTVPFATNTDFDVDDNDIRKPEFSVRILEGPSNGRLDTIENGLYTYIPNANFIGIDQLTYELCSPSCECSTAQVTFTVGTDAECTPPSIITPNNDNYNDAFIIPCLSEQNKPFTGDLLIFNQWGDEVFRQADYQNNWQGTYDGEDLPASTYFYVLTFSDGREAMSGFVVIQR